MAGPPASAIFFATRSSLSLPPWSPSSRDDHVVPPPPHQSIIARLVMREASHGARERQCAIRHRRQRTNGGKFLMAESRPLAGLAGPRHDRRARGARLDRRKRGAQLTADPFEQRLGLGEIAPLEQERRELD